MDTFNVRGSAKRTWDRVVDWWRNLWPDDDTYKRHRQQPEPEAQDEQPEPTPQPAEEDAGRYQVQQPSGDVAHQTDNLGDALEAWRQLTQQQGTIIDTETGDNLTPDPDDNGRFAVLDEDGEQIGTFDRFDQAEQVWASETGKEGSIIDTLEEKDVTPFSGHLTDEEVEAAVALVRQLAGPSYGFSRDRNRSGMKIDVDEVTRLIPVINALRLPIFELANAIGDSHNMPTHTVTVTKREADIDYKQVPYLDDVPLSQPPTRFEVSSTPQDHHERRPMRSHGEIRHVAPHELVMPDFEGRYARLSLPVVDPMEEVTGEVPTTKVTKYREEQTIVPREWQEDIEVTDEARIQRLAAILDVSISMDWGYPRNIDVAVALFVVLVTKHLNDGSTYSLRFFANYVDNAATAESTQGKKQLIQFVMDLEPETNIGSGTNIMGGIEAAANDVSTLARDGNEVMEVLVISDGDDPAVTSQRIFDCIGTDVVLHTVMVGGSNSALKSHSTTYDEIHEWQLRGGGRHPHGRYNDPGW